MQQEHYSEYCNSAEMKYKDCLHQSLLNEGVWVKVKFEIRKGVYVGLWVSRFSLHSFERWRVYVTWIVGLKDSLGSIFRGADSQPVGDTVQLGRAFVRLSRKRSLCHLTLSDPFSISGIGHGFASYFGC